jgi:aminoglycoside phosphotransferase (APT) family kinase protein
MPVELDGASPVRAGEELPLAPLEAYLNQHLGIPSAGPRPLVVEQFAQGHSNLTYLVRLGGGGGGDATELVLRRGPFGNQVKTAHDMGREYRVLSRLWTVYPPAPRPVLFCDDPAVLGAPFYLMERRRGIVLRKQLPRGLVLDEDTARRLSITLIDNLAALHALDYRAAGLGDLGKPEGYVQRQVTGWTERYARARTDDLPALDHLARWLAEHLPPAPIGAALIHNDYKYDNLVLDPTDLTRIVAVLDWEMATVGDPLMDLGTTLGYWVEAGDPPALRDAAFGPTALPGSLSRRALAERYADRSGRDISGVLFHYAFGLFKIAVIIQQIYARYARGHTHDARFAHMNDLVAVLAEQAGQAIARGGL